MNNKKAIQDNYQPRLERISDQSSNKLERGYQPKPMQGDSKPPSVGIGIKPPQK